MITMEDIKLADQTALGTMAASQSDFDWRAWYLEKADAFKATAQSWRSIAHTCQLAGDEGGVRMAHHNALENEMWEEDARKKSAAI